jgi:hypothetical protein
MRFEVFPRLTTFKLPPDRSELRIQEIYSALVNDESRTDLVVSDVVSAIESGRFPLVLTERTDHLVIGSALMPS